MESYEAIGEKLQEYNASNVKVGVHMDTCNAEMHRLCKDVAVKAANTVKDTKAEKNVVEQEGMRACNIRDCAAIMKYFAYLEEELRKEKEAAVRRCVQLEKGATEAVEASRREEQRAAAYERFSNDTGMEADVLSAKLRQADAKIAEADEPLTSVSLVANMFVARYLKDAKTKVSMYALDGSWVRDVSFPGIGSASGFGGKRTDTETFYSFSSYATPPSVYRYDMISGKRKRS